MRRSWYYVFGQIRHFNSRTSCEVRQTASEILATVSNFNSRTSCEVRLNTTRNIAWLSLFQLTHLLRGATRRPCRLHRNTTPISTHAPLARCDIIAKQPSAFQSISTHAPLARCDASEFRPRTRIKISTHAPLARCDTPIRYSLFHLLHFNSRTSCEVRLDWNEYNAERINFNSRTSCEVRRAVGSYC